MIEAYRVDAIEVSEIVFIRRIVSMPCHHVQWRMVDLRGPQMTLKFRDQAKITGAIFIGGTRRLEITRIGESVRANRAQVRQSEKRAIIFANVASRLLVR